MNVRRRRSRMPVRRQAVAQRRYGSLMARSPIASLPPRSFQSQRLRQASGQRAAVEQENLKRLDAEERSGPGEAGPADAARPSKRTSPPGFPCCSCARPSSARWTFSPRQRVRDGRGGWGTRPPCFPSLHPLRRDHHIGRARSSPRCDVGQIEPETGGFRRQTALHVERIMLTGTAT